jgi:hypothetical protein
VNAEKRWTDDHMLAVAHVATAGAVSRATGRDLATCPYRPTSGAARVWRFAWWRANAILATDLDDEAAACFEEAA